MIVVKKRKVRDPNLECWDIYLTRGDSGYIDFDLVDEAGNPIVVDENATVRCHVRKAPNGGDLLFDGQIEIVDNKATWHIVPENTKTAELDDYFWDAQIEYPNGDVFTFIPSSYFKLMPEVTEREGD